MAFKIEPPGLPALDQRMAQEGKLLKLYVLSLTGTAVGLFVIQGGYKETKVGKIRMTKTLNF